ncbi:uncharacterized protein LOC134670535 [Cydia fagiglandana]|uniref:uncharacterized protein LOC134670535 n=1 Tax=Cydia fagiglandana TaxID=1458189 RepID=UPI002FEE0418
MTVFLNISPTINVDVLEIKRAQCYFFNLPYPMGIKLIVLLGLLLGVLYCIHLLVQDYQALSAPRMLFRFLFKRDVNAQNYTKPHVRWRRILLHDPIQCARYLYCDLGARPSDTEPRKGFVVMLTLDPHAEDKLSHEVFAKAYESGKLNSDAEYCKKKYYMCPFDAGFLFEIIQYLLKT